MISGILLAAGLSTRYSAGNKLLAGIDGVALVRRTAKAYVDAGLDELVVVTGHEREKLEEALHELPLRFVHNPRFAEGQSGSLHAGIQGLAPSTEAAIIGVADQPYLSNLVLQDMVKTYRSAHCPLVVPRYDGQRGNPVLFDSALFSELQLVQGDIGGRPVLKAHSDEICWVDFPTALWAFDVDTVQDLHSL
ncbi:MAG TPA: nucleotidyltransferase family protein [Chloroflexi bacterium]|jgi:molybdenum cofactor cytidylyltransferase|nr:nucleotidyltransferase family protein [Chloroflexota bacterium]